MHALPIMIVVLCTLAIAYRYYSAFLAAKVAALDDRRVTPAHELNDGQNYHPTNKWVLFGHHFAAISGAGPLIGPVLAAQFGYMPGLLWLLIGVCLAGAVQDFLILAASLRHKGRSLAQMAREEIGAVSGAASVAAILFIVVVALAGLGIAVVKALSGEEVIAPEGSRIVLAANAERGLEASTVSIPEGAILYVPLPAGALRANGATEHPFPLPHSQKFVAGSAAEVSALLAAKPGESVKLPSGGKLLVPGSSWGVFTIGMSIPIALLMGLWMYVIRKKSPTRIAEASAIGVVLLLTCVWLGSKVPGTPLGDFLNLSRHQIIMAMAVYGFIASVLPVWLLLCPRDYLSSYLKIGTIALLIGGVLIVNPELKMPAVVEWGEQGPNGPGRIFPFLFIMIMCGAISGFHALVSSGTTPKMIDKEGQARMIGYGAMLMEGLVGIVALIAASSLAPGDYYAIQIPFSKQVELISKSEKLHEIDGDHDSLRTMELDVGENLRGRTGGAVTLAVGMSQIFAGFPWLKSLVKFWYHFAIMFEALFILTTVDTGTRIGRFLVQEVAGKINPQFGKVDWWPGAIASTLLIVFGWAWLLWEGNIQTIWPMFGIANQLLAVVAMCVATTIIFNSGRGRFAPITMLPLAFIVSTTTTAGYYMLIGFYKKADWLNFALTAVMLLCVVVVLLDSIRRWINPRSAAMIEPKLAAGE
ncbi:MAG TPA: carbon starvation protein A [Planctomycetota bacterium]|nr:carbon starvation protein A [Planctomycetota bacterium]